VDYPLIAIVAVMLALGLALVFSASYAYAGTEYFVRQGLWIALGIVAAFIMANIDYRVWRTLALPIMIAALGLLVAVLFFGEDLGGARRTFSGSIQPGEIAKLAVVIYVSAWVASKGRQLSQVREGLLPFIIIMGSVALLLVLEPSFSVTMIVLIIGASIFFVGGGQVGQILLLGVVTAPALVLLFWRSGYAAERINRWLSGLRSSGQAPSDTIMVWQKQAFDPQSIVDRIAGFSRVPLPWSDYLYAYTAELLGFLGALLIVVLYALLAYRLLAVALNAPDRFATFMAVGITAWVVAQALIHIGASTRLLPETGQPLPFMSYGGSAMLACMAALGLMQSIARASPAKKALNANLVFGGWNRRPRLSDSDRGERTTAAHQRSHTTGSASTRPASSGRTGARPQGASGSSAAYGHRTATVERNEVTGKPAWRSTSATGKRKPRSEPTRSARKPTRQR
jgi:cell division protein FtsW